VDSKRDFIFLEGLKTRSIIGIYHWERKVRQTILIDLVIPIDNRRSARRDWIEDTLNYKALAKLILREVPKTRFQLVESLAEFIASLCLKNFPLPSVTVRVSKPGAIRGSRNVGVQITRRVASRRSR